VALWMLASARVTAPRPSRWRMAAGGVAMGLALGAKWSVLPVELVVGGAVLAARALRPRERGVGLGEMTLWLVAVPLATYWLSFAPGFLYAHDPISAWDVLGWHRHMIALQTSVTKHHPYQSVWSEWVINWRAIWYLYEPVDGAQRGIMLIGNPITMLAGLGALGWCAARGWLRREALPLLVVALYGASLGLWIVGHKPVQFYYHYLLPGTFLMAALALAVEEMWRRWRVGALAIMALSLGVFGWFYPIIAAMPLHKGAASFADWTWLGSWI
jgi:dolichyl-phosphate-mannose-protein mannosyltransferase